MRRRGVGWRVATLPSAPVTDLDGFLSASPMDRMVTVWWSVRFHPANSVDLNEQLTPNNGISLDGSKDTIYIWSSSNGSSGTFVRAD